MFSRFQKWVARFRSEAPAIPVAAAPVARTVSATPRIHLPLSREEKPASKIVEALAQRNNPGTSFSNAAHAASRKEVANVLALLICNADEWKELGDNQHEVAARIGRLIDSYE